MKNFTKRMLATVLTATLSVGFLTGCGTPTNSNPVVEDEQLLAALEEIYLDDISVPLAPGLAPSPSAIKIPSADGKTTYGNNNTTIDASNTSEGYVMVKYSAGETRRIKVQVQKTGGIVYTYDLAADGNYDAFPLSQGNGEYKITIFRNVSDNKYAQMYTKTIDVSIANATSVFLYANQYVDFNAESKVVSKAAELTKDITNDLDKVSAIFKFVVENFTYDYDLAKNVKSGYLPVVDTVLEKKTGICFDYAAVMAAMLRSQGIPARLEVGYTSGGEYHAWISVFITNVGWVNGAISFNGVNWTLMDPTFASSGKQSKSVMEYISNPNNYSTKYCY